MVNDMEEGKKKRWRPSLTEYRTLEERIVMTEREYGDALEALARKREEYERLLEVNNALRGEIASLRGRGFFKRLFNK